MAVKGLVVMDVKTPDPEVIVKFTFDISKKILPTASTFILALELMIFGIVTVSEPSFGTFETNVYGKVYPLSTDNKMFTFAVLIGDRFVEATFQVIVAGWLAISVTLVLG